MAKKALKKAAPYIGGILFSAAVITAYLKFPEARAQIDAILKYPLSHPVKSGGIISAVILTKKGVKLLHLRKGTTGRKIYTTTAYPLGIFFGYQFPVVAISGAVLSSKKARKKVWAFLKKVGGKTWDYTKRKYKAFMTPERKAAWKQKRREWWERRKEQWGEFRSPERVEARKQKRKDLWGAVKTTFRRRTPTP